MISAEINMILVMNELFSASDETITSSKSQSVWYIIITNAEVNMILAMNELFSTCDKTIYCDKTLISLRASNVWYIIVINAKANMMLIIKNLLKKVQIHYHDLYYIC